MKISNNIRGVETNMTNGLIKGKRWEITYTQLDYIEKYDKETWERYYKLIRKNEKIRIRRKVISLLFTASLLIICYCVMSGVITISNRLDLVLNVISKIAVISVMYFGALFYGFLITNINNKEILEIAQEYGTVSENK
ncbi:hypothetical protein [Oceanirhabdus sp. W0125-5]|uniref:hypothetical protein n=1 Tax=Oceanirhabdus sp. W0125-5 TaxID=2999116 RepID=UPI0022F2C729|nr:hypothetical protein [Oceanirhabdus sp. W0125-5]WBW98325.1 hypothetical protein OW730_06025 [Oceanirhabdus sp. W0125-5]